jgi:hypothetical protein
MQRGSTDLAGALRHGVSDGEDLIGLLIEQVVVITKVWTGYVPVEVLGLEVEGKRSAKSRFRAPAISFAFCLPRRLGVLSERARRSAAVVLICPRLVLLRR